jgi:hypothetical protein
VRHDPDVPLDRLAWNRLEGPYRFHYTTRFAAQMIVGSETYIVGARAAPGLYVTDIMPGELTDTQLLNALLDGTRELERVQAAVVLHDDIALPLVQCGARSYVHAAPPGERGRIRVQAGRALALREVPLGLLMSALLDGPRPRPRTADSTCLHSYVNELA